MTPEEVKRLGMQCVTMAFASTPEERAGAIEMAMRHVLSWEDLTEKNPALEPIMRDYRRICGLALLGLKRAEDEMEAGTAATVVGDLGPD